jgi:hypothetical protein
MAHGHRAWARKVFATSKGNDGASRSETPAEVVAVDVRGPQGWVETPKGRTRVGDRDTLGEWRSAEWKATLCQRPRQEPQALEPPGADPRAGWCVQVQPIMGAPYANGDRGVAVAPQLKNIVKNPFIENGSHLIFIKPATCHSSPKPQTNRKPAPCTPAVLPTLDRRLPCTPTPTRTTKNM